MIEYQIVTETLSVNIYGREFNEASGNLLQKNLSDNRPMNTSFKKRERTNCQKPTWMPKYLDIYVHVQYKEINIVCSANHSIQNDKINGVF